MIDPVTLAVVRGRLEQIVDEMDATIFVDPGLGAEVDRFGNLVVKPDA